MDHPFATTTSDAGRTSSDKPNQLPAEAVAQVNGANFSSRPLPWLKPPFATTQALGEEGGDFPPNDEF